MNMIGPQMIFGWIEGNFFKALLDRSFTTLDQTSTSAQIGKRQQLFSKTSAHEKSGATHSPYL